MLCVEAVVSCAGVACSTPAPQGWATAHVAGPARTERDRHYANDDDSASVGRGSTGGGRGDYAYATDAHSGRAGGDLGGGIGGGGSHAFGRGSGDSGDGGDDGGRHAGSKRSYGLVQGTLTPDGGFTAATGAAARRQRVAQTWGGTPRPSWPPPQQPQQPPPRAAAAAAAARPQAALVQSRLDTHVRRDPVAVAVANNVPLTARRGELVTASASSSAAAITGAEAALQGKAAKVSKGGGKGKTSGKAGKATAAAAGLQPAGDASKAAATATTTVSKAAAKAAAKRAEAEAQAAAMAQRLWERDDPAVDLAAPGGMARFKQECRSAVGCAVAVVLLDDTQSQVCTCVLCVCV